MHDGTVSRVAKSESYGYVVYIDHVIYGQKIQTRYAHLKENSSLKVGDPIQRGAKVGLMGNTGRSFGVHLHFETRTCGSKCDNTDNPTPVDPLLYYKGYLPEFIRTKNTSS